MNLRRFLLSVAIASVVTLVLDVLLNAVVFREVYARAAPFLLPADQLNARLVLGWGALLLIVAAFGAIFAQGPWTGVQGGFTFGALLGVASLAGVAGLASVFPWPPALFWAISLQQLLNALVLGVIFGLVYRPTASA